MSNIIEQINVDGTTYNIASTAYAVCSTAANTQIKDVIITGFNLIEGVTIHIKFQNNNSVNNPKLRINSNEAEDAKPIVQYGTTATGITDQTNGWYAGSIITFTYDGTSWIRDQGFNTTDITELGTITTGTWNAATIGTDHGGTGNVSFTTNRLLYTSTATQINSTTNIYASTNKIGINTTSEPTQNLYVDGTVYFSSNFGIGGVPYAINSNEDHDHILTIYGSTLIRTATTKVAHLDIFTENNITTFKFVPETDTTGYIGFDNQRWKQGYFSNLFTVGSITNGNLTTGIQANGTGTLLVQTSLSSSISIDMTLKDNKDTGKLEIISNGSENILLQTQNTAGSKLSIASGNSTILLQTIHTSNTNISEITIAAITPTIKLDTLTNNASNWIINNNSGTFSINDQKTSPAITTELRSTSENWYFEGHVSPLTNNNWNLGTADTSTANENDNGLRWKALYLGTADTYGDPYQPIYWNNGVPDTVSPVQYFTWALTNISTSSTATNITYYSDAFTNNTYVLSLVVTQGQQYLESSIEWDSTTNGQLKLRANITKSPGSDITHSVSGYIILARGCTLVPTTTPPSNS